jgi:hypothetical protein
MSRGPGNRCASTPFNRHSHYHLQRYSFYREALRRYEMRFGHRLQRLHLITCVVDEFKQSSGSLACRAYLADLLAFLRIDCGVQVASHMLPSPHGTAR